MVNDPAVPISFYMSLLNIIIISIANSIHVIVIYEVFFKCCFLEEQYTALRTNVWLCVFQEGKHTICLISALNMLHINTGVIRRCAASTRVGSSCSTHRPKHNGEGVYLVYSSEQWTVAVLITQCHAADAIIVTRERERDEGVSPRRAALIPLRASRRCTAWASHWFMLCVSYGRFRGHWGNWWPFKRKQPSWVAFSGARQRGRKMITRSNCLYFKLAPYRVQTKLSHRGKGGRNLLWYGNETQNYSKKKRHSCPKGGFFGWRVWDRGEAAKQFNPSPISCESPLISVQMLQPKQHSARPSTLIIPPPNFPDIARGISPDVTLLLITAAEPEMSRVKDGERVKRAGDRGEAAGLLFYWICAQTAMNLWICIGVQIIQTPPKGLVWRESMLIRGCVPKIRAHNLEDISCSTLMVNWECVSSDCWGFSLSLHLNSKNIFLFYFLIQKSYFKVTPYTTRRIKVLKNNTVPWLSEKSWTPVLWFYQGDIASRKSFYSVSSARRSPLWQLLVIQALQEHC